MQAWIITGASRGIGEALAAALLSPSRRVIGIARHPSEKLEAMARHAGAFLDYYLQDLSDLTALETLADSIFTNLPSEVSSAVLVNNAAMVEPVGPASVHDAASIERSLIVNVAAPMVLTSAFLRSTGKLSDRRIINISSGAGRNAIGGWAAYCTSKAALDMYSRCVALDETERNPKAPARIVSLAPGIVDTAMQASIRSVSSDLFSEVQRFKDYKDSGALAAPDDIARRIINLAARNDFGHKPVDDLRNYS